jgi:ketosteroid isomerase-like protein
MNADQKENPEMDAATLAERLVLALGHPEEIDKLVTDDVEWWISPTVEVLGSPCVGREPVIAAMRVIFSELWLEPKVTVHHRLGSDDIGAVRFTLRAKAHFAGDKPYENEYTIWIRRSGDRIDRVWEYLDVAWSMKQLGF